MTVRTDIVVDPSRSPRIVTVLAPETELTVQDLHDTLRAWEDSEEGVTFDVIVESAGKEELGGGVRVGVTTTLQNALVEFEPRNTVAETGTATTGDGAGLVLIDTAAAFLSTVTIGAHVLNATTGASSSVRDIDSDSQVTLVGLGGGTRQDWQVGDTYYAYNVIQCAVAGGNLVAVDASGVTLDTPLYPSFCTQVKLASASSATLQEQSDIQYSSYQNGVWVDVINGVPGVKFPIGTPRAPVSNLTDAQSIADVVGLNTIYVLESLTITAGPDHTDMLFIGRSPKTTAIHIDAAAVVTDCEYQAALVSGTLDGSCYITSCAVKNLLFISGHLETCVLREGTISLAGSGIGMINRCSSVDAFDAGVGIPEIDFNGSGQTVALQGFDGSIRLKNKSGPENVEINLAAGKVWIDADVTAGIINVRGVGEVVDNSTGTTVVNTDGLLNATVIAATTWASDLSTLVPGEAGYSLEQLLNLVEADYDATTAQLIVKHRSTGAVLLTKAISGGDVIPVALAEL
jgi:hypothetical protein